MGYPFSLGFHRLRHFVRAVDNRHLRTIEKGRETEGPFRRAETNVSGRCRRSVSRSSNLARGKISGLTGGRCSFVRIIGEAISLPGMIHTLGARSSFYDSEAYTIRSYAGEGKVSMHDDILILSGLLGQRKSRPFRNYAGSIFLHSIEESGELKIGARGLNNFGVEKLAILSCDLEPAISHSEYRYRQIIFDGRTRNWIAGFTAMSLLVVPHDRSPK
jgi:hypothetical protein